jgi:hypothetical protein
MNYDPRSLRPPMGDPDTIEAYYNQHPEAAMFRYAGEMPNFNKPSWNRNLMRLVPSLMSEYTNMAASDPSLSFSAFLGLSEPMARVHKLGPRGRGEQPMNFAPKTRYIRRG